MKLKYFIPTIITIVIAYLLYQTLEWSHNGSANWYIPGIRACHLGGMPGPGANYHCHWVWESPHQHPV